MLSSFIGPDLVLAHASMPISVSLASKVTIGGLGQGNGKTPFSKLIHVEHGIKPLNE